MHRYACRSVYVPCLPVAALFRRPSVSLAAQLKMEEQNGVRRGGEGKGGREGKEKAYSSGVDRDRQTDKEKEGERGGGDKPIEN